MTRTEAGGESTGEREDAATNTGITTSVGTESEPSEERQVERQEREGIRQKSSESRIRKLERKNAVLTALLKGLATRIGKIDSRLNETEAQADAHSKQLQKVRTSIKKDSRGSLDEYDRANGWTDLQHRVHELELEVSAENLSRLDRLTKMSTRQLRESDDVFPREVWAVLLLRNFDGWSTETVSGDVWFVRDGMKRMFHNHLQLDVEEPSEIGTKKVHRACDELMELTDGEVLWVSLERGRALLRPKNDKKRAELEKKVKRTGD